MVNRITGLSSINKRKSKWIKFFTGFSVKDMHATNGILPAVTIRKSF